MVSLRFSQLVSGVLWLVKDGQSYVNESALVEHSDTSKDHFETFIRAMSARTAVGHDAQGRLHMVQVNGRTGHAGVDLREFADLLISFGITNAINLDGGGSATSVINGTLRNYPSDNCPGSDYNCPRRVSTILCVHNQETPIPCSPPDCFDHTVGLLNDTDLIVGRRDQTL